MQLSEDAIGQVSEVTLSVSRIDEDGNVTDIGVVDSYVAPLHRKAINKARRLVREFVSELGVLIAPRQQVILGGVGVHMANVIVNGGHQFPAKRLYDNAAAIPKYIGWGTGAGTAAASDTTLFSEKADDLSSTSGTRSTGTTGYTTTTNTDDTATCSATKTATGAGTVTNAGLFTSATMGSGSLYAKGDHASQALTGGQALVYTFAIKFS